MSKSRVFSAMIFVTVALSCAPAEETAQEPIPVRAMAELNPTEGNTVSGTVYFEQANEEVIITADLSGLSAGKHGFHVHETGDCSGPGASSADGHFNPFDVTHGSPTDPEHHVGDLGNIEADEQGNAHFDLTVDFLSLGEEFYSILGKAMIVHAQEDDLDSRFVGNAGPRVACGVIEVESEQ